MKTFDFNDDLRKETAKKGTGSFPVLFRDDTTGKVYEPSNIKTIFESDSKDGVTMVYLKEVTPK